MSEILVPKGLAGWKARRTLRRHLRDLEEGKFGDDKLGSPSLFEHFLCMVLLAEGKLDESSLDKGDSKEARELRLAFVAIARLLGQWPR